MVLIEGTIIGKKGEILPKKRIRKMAGLAPGDKVIIEGYPNKIVIRKVLSIDDVFALPEIARGTPREIEEQLHAEGELQEKSSLKKGNRRKKMA
jgi:bifunctional DNA-binding transcriptional regulator/antitoxin component of YhaV-PrlF toxin-antitoxin module